MIRRAALLIVATITGVMAANAADLPVQSRLGAAFAEPVPPQKQAYEPHHPAAVIAWRLRTDPPVPGYYGKPSDFYYRTYYNAPSDALFDRLPYACNFYGYC